MSAPNTAIDVDVDFFAPDVLRDPYPIYAELRALGPVLRSTLYGYYILPRYAEAVAAESDWETFTTRFGVGLSDIRRPDAWRAPGPVVETDPPEHTHIRSTLTRIIPPAVVRGWSAPFEQDATQLVRGLSESRTFDVVKDFAEAFVLTVFPRALGVEVTREQAMAFGHLNFNAMGPRNELFHSSEAAVKPFQEWLQQTLKRESMRPGGIGEKVYQAVDRGELGEDVAARIVLTFLRGGMDTTITAMASAVWLLATHPTQWELLRQRPELIRNVFDETLRLECPVQGNFRTTTKAAELAGIHLEPDTKVQVLLASANRDEQRWNDADTFDITRNTAGHLGLGSGIHNCLGQMIARVEFEALFRPFVQLVQKIELDGEPTRRINNVLRSFERIPVRVVPALSHGPG